MSAAGFLCLPLFYIVTLSDALLSSSAEASTHEVFHDPCAVSADPHAIPRLLHGGSGGKGLLSNIALALGSIACVFLVVATLALAQLMRTSSWNKSMTAQDNTTKCNVWAL